jgi:tRNA modification GTPase
LEAETLDFLSQRPLHTVGLVGFIRDNGLVSERNRGTFYGCRNRQGKLEGVALIGHATLMETTTDRALQAFADLVRQGTDLSAAERMDIEGLLITLVDTAGSRVTHDVVEREGVSRGSLAREVADLCLVVLDGATPLSDEDRAVLRDTGALRRLVVVNKSDVGRRPQTVDGDEPAVHVSARTESRISRTHPLGIRSRIVRLMSANSVDPSCADLSSHAIEISPPS